jgi:hypothetical protein
MAQALVPASLSRLGRIRCDGIATHCFAAGKTAFEMTIVGDRSIAAGRLCCRTRRSRLCLLAAGDSMVLVH